MSNDLVALQKVKLEHYRQGYPRLAAFLNLDSNFKLLKRFDYLHLRVLIEQQALLNELETKLNQCDDAENIQMHLSSCRKDGNQTRRQLLTEIRSELESYADKAILRYSRVLALPEARSEHRKSVRNWVDGTKPLVRSESGCFLENPDDQDFLHLGTNYTEYSGIESLLDAVLRRLPTLTSRILRDKTKTDNPNIVLFSPALLREINAYLLMVLVPLWLVVPVMLLDKFSGDQNRTILYSIFILVASWAVTFVANLSKSKFIMAMITYGAVLAAFLSGGSRS